MSLCRNKNNLLISAVLASTLFGLSYITEVNAQLVLNTLEPGPYSTTVNGNVTVSQTGAIQSASGITPSTIDAGFGTLTLSEGNKYYLSGTLLPTDTIAVEVTSRAINATLAFNPVSSIVSGAASHAIDVNGDNLNLYNAGNITVIGGSTPGNSALNINANNANVFNDITGIISNSESSTNRYSLIYVNNPNGGFTLDNRGLIQGNAAQAEVLDLSDVSSITSVRNSGFIQQTGSTDVSSYLFAVVDIEPYIPFGEVGVGNFTNAPTGVISFLGEVTNGNTVLIDGSLYNFLNEGIIENLATNSTRYNTGNAIYVADYSLLVQSLQNKGLILSRETVYKAPTILVTNPYFQQLIASPINNTGFIVNEVIGSTAVDLSNANLASFNNTGIVVGDVLLAQDGAAFDVNVSCEGYLFPVLTMDNGAITGRVIGNSNSGYPCSDDNIYLIQGGTLVSIENAPGTPYIGNLYNFTGGEIIDYVNTVGGAVMETQNIMYLSGTKVGVINGAMDAENVFLASSGSFYSLQSVGWMDMFFVSQQFTSNGVVDLNMFIVGFGGNPPITTPSIFTHNQLINANSFYTLSGSTFIQNATIRSMQSDGFNNMGTHVVTTPHAWFDFSMNSPSSFYSYFANMGNLLLGPQGVMRISGNNDGSTNGNTLFWNAADDFLNVFIDGPQCAAPIYGKLIVDSFTQSMDPSSSVQAVYLQKDSFIQPLFSGFLPRGSTFDIITVYTGGYANPVSPLTITNDATLVPYPSALVYFTEETLVLPIEGSIFGNDQFTSVVRLTANRNSFLSESSTKVTKGIAQTLDSFADQTCIQNTDIYRLISEFDQLPTQSQVENSMESLVPGFNYALIAGSHVGMDSAFEAITDRVYDLAFHRKRGENLALNQQQLLADAGQFSGRNYGDINLDFGFWARAVGAYLSQSARQGIAGYIAKGEGLAIGGDWGPTDCSVFGVAASYTKVNVDDKSWAPKEDDIKSWQGTLYGAYEFDCGVYLDAMVAYAHNDYKTNRVIHVNNLLTAAQGSFDGRQWGAQGDLGIDLPNVSCIDVVPFIRLKYITVDFDSYTETGGGTYSLNVSSQNASEFLGGAGLRVGTEYEQCGITWIPEVMALIGYDFHLEGEQTLAGFVGSTGPAFGTNGIVPGRTVLDVGIALNGISGASIFTAKYNLEVRDQFVGSAAYLQYYFTWA